MEQNKFEEIVREESDKIGTLPIRTPQEWKTAKPKLEEFIKEVDKAAEVFEIESTPNKGK